MRALSMRHAVNHDSFAARLRRAREHSAISTDELCLRAGLSERRLASLEGGGSAPPSAAEVSKLAGALQVQSLWLMAGEMAGRKFAPVWEGGGR